MPPCETPFGATPYRRLGRLRLLKWIACLLFSIFRMTLLTRIYVAWARHPLNLSSHLHHLQRLDGVFLCSSSVCEVNSSLRRSNSELIISLIVSKHANRSSKKRWAAAWRSCELFLGCFLFLNAVIDFLCLTMAKFGRFTPNRLALIGQKYALIGHFHFCRLALIGHGHFRKSLIMNKSSWKYGSFPKICKQLIISPTSVFWILIFNFPPCRFQRKAINETTAGKPTFFSSYPHSPTTNRIVARAAPKYT